MLLAAVYNFCKDKKLEFKLSKEEYKATVQMASDDENIVDFVAEVSKVKKKAEDEEIDEDDSVYEDVDEDDDEVKYCIQLRKKRGPKQDFIKIFNKLRYFLQKLNNTDELPETVE